MAAEDTIVVKEAYYVYRITFGNKITAPKTDINKLILSQGEPVGTKDTESDKNFVLILRGVKVNKKIYQPCEIEAELDFQEATKDSSGNEKMVVPSQDAVSGLLKNRMVKLEMVHVATNNAEGDDYTIAENCYVYELNPMLIRVNNGTKMFVKLNIFSMDKLMTLSKYSKAYVGRKLGSGILLTESKSFGKIDDNTPLIKSTILDLNYLRYKEKIITLAAPYVRNATISSEFIHPYLVQYNESFYDFLVRCANRFGEFFYFEDGKLTLGLHTNEDPYEVKQFDSVVVQDRSSEPFDVSYYRRDSAKNGNEIGDYNQKVIDKDKDGYPSDIFPKENQYQYNAEVVNDEYIFPLEKDKFTDVGRERHYTGATSDIVLSRLIPTLKEFLSSEMTTWYIGLIVSLAKDVLVQEGVNAMVAKIVLSMTGGLNTILGNTHIVPYKNIPEQSDGTRATEYGTLDPAGWMTVDYYATIHKHQLEQEQKMICIDMGTNFEPLKLGQLIKVDGLEGNYVIVQIQQTSEVAWVYNYAKYGQANNDRYQGRRTQIVYAIPSFEGKDEDGKAVDKFVPPVHPVPLIRRSGPQTAFVAQNDDPKFQGRVRITYPWQTSTALQRAKLKLEEANNDLKMMQLDQDEFEKKKKELTDKLVEQERMLAEIRAFLKKSPEEQEKYLAEQESKKKALDEEYDGLEAQMKEKEAEKAAKEEKIKELKKKEKQKQTEEEDGKKPETGLSEADQEVVNLEVIKAMIEELQKKENENREKYRRLEILIANLKEAQKDGKAFEAKLEAEKQETAKEKEKAESKANYGAGEIARKQKEITNLTEQSDAYVKTLSSPWIRIATPMATSGGGTYFKPRVGDEVLVDYDNGNIERPYVTGSLFSKNVLTPQEYLERRFSPENQWANVSMAMVSPNGHHITFTDPPGGFGFLTNAVSPGVGMYAGMLGFNAAVGTSYNALNGGIHIGDRYGVYEIEMLSHKRSIDIKSPLGTISLNAFSGITINAPNGDVTIRGKNITLEAGNKINVLSGNNLPDPDYGDSPCGKTTAANISKAIVNGVSGALTDIFVTSVVDLSLVRHIIEVYIRPVDGTLLLKSKKFLKLEAGLGKAVVKRDRYKQKTKDALDKSEPFYIFLQQYIEVMCAVVDNFLKEYEEKFKKARDAKTTYEHNCANRLKDIDKPGIIKMAFDEKDNEKFKKVTLDDFKDCFKLDGEKASEGIDSSEWVGTSRRIALLSLAAEAEQLDAPDSSDKVKTLNEQLLFDFVEPFANEYKKAVHELHRFMNFEEFTKLFEIEDAEVDDDDFKFVATATKKMFNEGWFKDAFEKWVEGNKKDVLTNPDELANKTLFKRAAILKFLYAVYKEQDAENKQHPTSPKMYLYIGYDAEKVIRDKSAPMDSEYWWKRQVDVIDRWSQNSFLRGLWDNVVKKVLDRIFANFKGLKDKEVWDADLNGQILFSDREDSTLSFEGEGLHKETDGNQGNIRHLKWMLRDIK